MLRKGDAVLCVLVLGALACAWACLIGSGRAFFWGDLTYVHHPWRALAAQMLQAGRPPVWNPYAYLGMPFADQIQSSMWYPGTILFYLFPFATGLGLFHAAHYCLAWLLSYLWLRGAGFGRTACLAGASICAGCGVMVSRLPFINHLSTLALWPALPLCRRRPWLLGLALALSFLSGYTPILAGGAVAAVALVWVARARRGTPIWRPWAAAALWSMSAGAVLLLPAARLAAGSQRGGGLGLDDTLRFAFAPGDLLQWLSPLVVRPDDFSPAVFWWKTCYLGLAAWAAALLALPRLKSRVLAGLAVYLGAAWLLTLGGSTTPGLWAWTHAAPLRYIRYPGNLSYLVPPAFALLAAAGLHARRGAGWLAALLMAELALYATLAGPTVPASYFADPGPLVRRLQADLGEHRYLLSPRALQWHKGYGRGLEGAVTDLKHRLYGVTNVPYRLFAAGNFGEPLVPRACYDVMDFLYSRSHIDEAARWLPWAGVRLLLTREVQDSRELSYEGSGLWHVYRAPGAPSRAVWFDPEAGAALPAGLPPDGSGLPDYSLGQPLTVRRPREDRFFIRGWTEDGWVYLAEPRLAGWRAWLDGRPVPTEPALGAFQKLRVPAGRWELAFLYDPGLWRLGLALTVLTLAATAAYWVLATARWAARWPRVAAGAS